MLTVLTVAGGIILAVLFFVFLPHLIFVASALFALALIVGGLALVAVLLDPAVSQTWSGRGKQPRW